MRQPFDIFGLNCSARFFDLTHLLICLICSLSWFDPFCFPGLTSSLFRSHQLALLRITHRQTDRHTHAPSHHTHTHTHTPNNNNNKNRRLSAQMPFLNESCLVCILSAWLFSVCRPVLHAGQKPLPHQL